MTPAILNKSLQNLHAYAAASRCSATLDGNPKEKEIDYNIAIDYLLDEVPVYKPRNTKFLRTEENSYVIGMGCLCVIGDWILEGVDDREKEEEKTSKTPEKYAAELSKRFE